MANQKVFNMEIREIKSKLPILKVLAYYNLVPDKHNRLKCPFHEDKNPSLQIYPKTETFNCFGCNANGDVIEFIQLKEKCNKHEALKKATELINPNEITGQQVQAPPEPPNKNGKSELLEKLFAYFRTAVYSSHPAKNYAQDKSCYLVLGGFICANGFYSSLILAFSL
jgi:DNA primase